jgi:uncharacterized protein (TIGR00255 family)
MTGFGVGDAPLGSARVVVEARSVNHRFLDVHVRMPPELGEQAFFVEQLARARLHRGRYDLSVQLPEHAATGELDFERARDAYAELCRLRDELAPGTEVPLLTLSLVPDLFRQSGTGRKDTEAALEQGLDRSLAALDAMRDREGARLSSELSERVDAVDALCRAIAEGAALLPQNHAEKLRVRIARLMESAALSADPGRMETEIALFADRLDVTEEIVRLESHIHQFRSLMAAQEPVGRQLDFLLQEMGREANTIGSKCQDARLSHRVVELKAELSRIREQVQNVE